MANEADIITEFDQEQLGSQEVAERSALLDSSRERDSADNINIYLLQKAVDVWSEQHTADIELRKSYAKWFVGIVATEAVAYFVMFFLIGNGNLAFSESIIELMLEFGAVQIAGSIAVIVKYLFSRGSHVILKDISELIKATTESGR